ncbi:CPBP family intramembrane glutamic endopeptidase [Indiicoccus explosivorum]|uniref:CPBP family intramembrane glutamic endopeptidase n=1 Tax=Indiicoccus explosivorum TaxID=1917864 RepID=UPI000B44345D|nr:CPBP family intramembrane glutamic endopeptidase [Indiicoccus explosivorum]
MKTAIRLIGPTVIMFIGLTLIGNVPITFLLFYGWLLGVPLLERAFPAERFKSGKRDVMWGIGSGLLFFLFIFVGMRFLHIYLLDIGKLRVLLVEWGFSGPGEGWLVLVFLLVNPVLEEIYWRGYVYDRLRPRGKVAAIWITAVFYALYHLLTVNELFTGGFSLLAVLPVLLAGLFWGILREKTGSITPTIIGHGLADLGILFVYWFIVK